MALREETSDRRKETVPALAKQAPYTERAKNRRKMARDQTTEQPAETSAEENRRRLTRVNDELRRLEEEVRYLDFERPPEETLNALKTLGQREAKSRNSKN
jgi:hypothetical protein